MRLPGESIEAWSVRRRREARTPEQVKQDEANEAARQAERNKPRHLKAFPASAGLFAPSKVRQKEAVDYFTRPADERAKDIEPTEADLRRQMQKSHPDKPGGDAGAFIAVKAKLDQKRRKPR